MIKTSVKALLSLLLFFSSNKAWAETIRGLSPTPKTEICHRGDDGSLKTIKISGNALEAHLEHGDFAVPCEDLSCSDICNHQSCFDDFRESDEEGCVCLEQPSETICGNLAECVEATDHCECPLGYIFDTSANCIPEAPLCPSLSLASTAQLEAAKDADLCPRVEGIAPYEFDCVTAFAYKEGASVPFSFWNEAFPWGYAVDLARACPDGLKSKPTVGGVVDSTDACILDILHGAGYDDTTIYPHIKIFLWSNAWAYAPVSPSVTDPNSPSYIPYWIYRGPRGHRWYAAAADQCPLPLSSFDGRNFQCPIGDYSCRYITIRRGGLSLLTLPSPPPIDSGFFTLQLALWSDYIPDEPPIECPCWDASAMEGINTVLVAQNECSWSPTSSAISLSDRENGQGESGSTSVEASFTLYSRYCNTWPQLDGGAWQISSGQFDSCYSLLRNKCAALGRDPGPNPLV